jgi:hypothetical protein
VNCLMFGPDPLVVGDDAPIAQHPDPVQVGGDLDPPPDYRRVHRVVVAVQAHVVIARQPLRRPPAHHRGDRWQGEHRETIRVNAIRRPAAQCPMLAGVRPRKPSLQLLVEVSR